MRDGTMEQRLTLLVGRKTYSVVTSLGEERAREVSEVVRQVLDQTDPSLSQEERLFLVSMLLASQMVHLRERLEILAGPEGEESS
ncbi:cell division protein ZapA [Aminomonas paucivorans]|nr:cell division protein ZapA [Aminomonas paucivorans]